MRSISSALIMVASVALEPLAQGTQTPGEGQRQSREHPERNGFRNILIPSKLRAHRLRVVQQWQSAVQFMSR
jgi:hypothetical protein